MNSIKVQSNKDTVTPCDCDELLIEYVDAFGSNLANLRQDVRGIVREEFEDFIREEFHKLVRELRKPKPYVEVGYRG
jgi:hypothetical protein